MSPERVSCILGYLLLAFGVTDATWNVFRYAAASELMFTGVALIALPELVAWIDRRLR